MATQSQFRSHWLANTTVNIFQLTQAGKLSGGKTDLLVPIFTDVCARINQVAVAVPFNVEGMDIRTVYHLHTWVDPNCSYINIPEGAYVDDIQSNKRYKVISSKVGNLWKMKPYKLVTEMIVLGDSRFTNYLEKI